MKLYAAYGSNLNKSDMAIRCPYAVPYGTGIIQDYELLFKGSKDGCAFLTIEPKMGGTVPMAIWEVGDEDERVLDRYEGYPSQYDKMMITIPTKRIGRQETEDVTAFVYFMNYGFERHMPSSRYLASCVKGYDDFSFNVLGLFNAFFRSVETKKDK